MVSGTARHALVTGAARGIGFCIAETLAATGLAVTATDIDAAAIAAAAAGWRATGAMITGRALDICDRAAVEALCADRVFDIVVNNAGIGAPLTGFAGLQGGDVERVLRVNLSGTFIVAQVGTRRMPAGGAVINIASRGYLGGAGAAHYVAAKAGVVGLTRAMAVELRWRDITVNAVAPGMVETRMIDDFTPAMRAALAALEPAGTAQSPQKIAEIVAYLASSVARAVTGQVLLADGGKSIGVTPW